MTRLEIIKEINRISKQLSHGEIPKDKQTEAIIEIRKLSEEYSKLLPK